LKPALSSLPNSEVLVVNNDPEDSRADEFANSHPDCQVLHNGGNYGFAHGCNLGARAARGELMLFLNPDTEDPGGQLLQLLACRESQTENRILGCRQVNAEGRTQKVSGRFPTVLNVLGPMRALSRILTQRTGTDCRSSQSDYHAVDWVSGSVLLMDRDAYQELNGWCDDFWMYSEDVDLCYRARQAGLEVGWTASATFLHHHASASRQDLLTDSVTRSEVVISRHLFAHKHLGAWQKPGYHLLLFISRYLVLTPVALLGAIWSKAPYRVKLRAGMFRHLTRYYKTMVRGIWNSPRAIMTKQSSLNK
jgi:GT2 family glycosyltransferase